MTVFLLQVELMRLLVQGVTADMNEDEKSPRIVLELKNECNPPETTEAATTKVV